MNKEFGKIKLSLQLDQSTGSSDLADKIWIVPFVRTLFYARAEFFGQWIEVPFVGLGVQKAMCDCSGKLNACQSADNFPKQHLHNSTGKGFQDCFH